MRILLDGASYPLWNVGDAAMLQISVARLRKLWSSATIQVLCASPERLSRYVPDAEAVPSNGQRKWLEWSRFPGRDRVPRAIARRLDSRFRARLPNLSDGLAFRRAKGHPTDRTDIEAFLQVADSADLLVLSGGGYMTDVFRGHAMSSLELLSRFQRRGAPTAMVGQGIGPLRDQTLLARARATLPRVGLMALREGRAALPLLDSLGVSRDRIRVTGDDAIEPAFAARPDRLGTSLGVNVRVSSYSGVGRDLFGELRTALRRAGEAVGAALLPVPISSAPADSDVESLRVFLPGGGPEGEWPEGLDTPLTVIRRVGECRVVVTGSYHAGVFALSQGIPVVGLSRSDYYTDKFLGLADQFGSGCRLVSLDEPLDEALPARIIELWREAEALRPDLLAAASRQIEEGREAYALLGLLTESPSVLPSDTLRGLSMTGEARNPPTVSVLLAVYNGQDHVRQAIEGILTQSFRDFEFIIVDDGSTDRTSQILDEYADPRIVRLRHPENRGLIAALNTGLAAARGEFVARQDADDFSYPDRFRAQVDFLRARPDIALVGSSWDFEPEGGERRTRTVEPDPLRLAWMLLFSCPLPHCSIMFRRQVIQDLGGYGAGDVFVEDFALWSRVVRSHRVANLEQTLVVRRRSAESITARHSSEMGHAARRISLQNLQWVAGSSISAAQRDALQYCLGNRPLPLEEALGLETRELRSAAERLFQEFWARLGGTPTERRRFRQWAFAWMGSAFLRKGLRLRNECARHSGPERIGGLRLARALAWDAIRMNPKVISSPRGASEAFRAIVSRGRTMESQSR